MKKTVLSTALGTAFAAILMTTPAFADNVFGGLKYKFYEYEDGSDSSAVEVSMGFKPLYNIAVDFTSEYEEFDDSESSTNQFEGGLTYIIPLNETFELFTRLGTGYLNVGDLSYFSADAGVKVYATDKISGAVSYRYKDSFDEDVQYRVDVLRVAGAVEITNHVALSAAWEGNFGDVESDAIIAGVEYQF